MLTAEMARLDRRFVETSSFSDLLADLTEKERLQAVSSRREPVPRIVQVDARGRTINFK
jgi:hypothetical protein